jgi:hypothetical protein
MKKAEGTRHRAETRVSGDEEHAVENAGSFLHSTFCLLSSAFIVLLLLVVALPAAAARRRAVTPTKGCPPLRAEHLVIWYQGAVSHCTATNGAFCIPGELIELSVRTFAYPVQCDAHTARWNFGDGSSAHSPMNGTLHHVYFASGLYTVRVDVENRRESATVQVTLPVVAFGFPPASP